MDISTQILFNRAMAQLGLAAFRMGLFPEAQACLSELYMGGRVRELLAQGVTQSRFHERSVEQEKLERRRQMPFHMHINLELLESVHLVCSMLQEVPYMANSMRRARSSNKPFARLVDNYERQTFNGPPENVRDHIMAATRCMLDGKWQTARDLILGLEVWALLPGDKDAVLAMVTGRLKEEAMRTYLFQFAAQYNSVSLDVISSMFDLERKQAYGLVSKMIINEELHGMCDEPSSERRHGPRRAQPAAGAGDDLAEKCAVLLDANERALDLHVGTGGAQLFDYEEESAAAAGGSNRRGGRGGRGGRGAIGTKTAVAAAEAEVAAGVVADAATEKADATVASGTRNPTATSPPAEARAGRETSPPAAAGSSKSRKRRRSRIAPNAWCRSDRRSGASERPTRARRVLPHR